MQKFEIFLEQAASEQFLFFIIFLSFFPKSYIAEYMKNVYSYINNNKYYGANSRPFMVFVVPFHWGMNIEYGKTSWNNSTFKVLWEGHVMNLKLNF